MKYKIFKLIPVIVVLFLLFSPFVSGQEITEIKKEEKITIYFFEDRLCSVCRDQKNFMEEIISDYPEIEIKTYLINDFEKLEEIALIHGVEDLKIMAPTTFIGENYFQFSHFTDKHKEMIVRALEGEIVDEDCCVVRIPILNIELDISSWSLPFITIILGSLDGLNVCSIGALILILSIVIIFNSRKKILFYGGLFIFTTVIVYGLLVFAWGQLFKLLIGHSEILSYVVGTASFLGGVYFFKEFYRFFRYGPTCKSSNNKFAIKATKRVQEVFKDSKKGSFALTTSIIFFATIITIIELPCSVGIPVAFTGILTEAGVSFSTFIFYILFYLFFYMLIEIIIFLGAVLTRKIWIANSKAITWVTLFGSLTLFYLSYYYFFGA
jgi:hypothetical protein